VVDFMLNNLSCPAGEGLDTNLKIPVLPAYLDGLPAPRLACAD